MSLFSFLAGGVPPGTTDFPVEAGEYRFEEGILYYLRDGLDDTYLRIVEWAREVGLGRHLFPRTVLENLPDPAHHALVHLLHEGLVPVLSGVVHHHVLEERLDVAFDDSIVNTQLRIEEEAALRHVELAVGAKEVVHGGQLHLIDLDREVKGRSGRLRAERRVGHRGAGSHELPLEV